MKKENSKLIIWAVVALVVSVVIGFLVNAAVTGNATAGIKGDPNLVITNKAAYDAAIKNNEKLTVISSGNSDDCGGEIKGIGPTNHCLCTSKALDFESNCNCKNNCPIYYENLVIGYVLCKIQYSDEGIYLPTID